MLCSGVGRSVRLGVDYKLLNLLLVTRDGDIKDRSDVSSFTFSFSCVSGMIPGSFTSWACVGVSIVEWFSGFVGFFCDLT